MSLPLYVTILLHGRRLDVDGDVSTWRYRGSLYRLTRSTRTVEEIR